MLVVDIQHWLDESGDLPLEPMRLRRNALRIAQLIEYGGPLEVGQMRETLVACTKRPGRKPCPGLMWVVKEADHRICSYCIACRQDELVISGREDTLWAEGMMEPLPAPPEDDHDGKPPTRH